MAIRIEQVDAGSEAEALGLAPGDELLSVDNNELNDTLDYDFYTDRSSFHLKARVADGIREWEVQRPQRGPFGCGFKTYLGDAKHSCSNHCMFCFIDQLRVGCVHRDIDRGDVHLDDAVDLVILHIGHGDVAAERGRK